MTPSEDSYEMEPRRAGRSQWLAMQSAYAEYRRASDALASSDQSTEDFSTWKNLEAQRRAAFEEYLEARMAYLESRFDEANSAGTDLAEVPTRDRSTLASRLGRRGLLVLALAIGVVGLTAYSAIRAQKRVRDLEASRDSLRAELSTARSDIQRVAAEMDVSKPAQPSAIPDTPQKAATLKPQPVSQPRRAALRRSYRFLLAPSRRFKRVGPIEVSIRSVDAKQNSISLSILSESVRLNLQHVRLNQPVRIDGRDPGQRMELIVDRIASDGIHGHLIEFLG